MRKISYTQMRAELSNILDAIRSGETVVVTQRGRPDTILNGSRNSEHSSILEARTPYSGPSVIEVLKSSDGHVRYVKKAPNGEILSTIETDGSKVSFNDALKLTQKKHAKIIKALEDK